MDDRNKAKWLFWIGMTGDLIMEIFFILLWGCLIILFIEHDAPLLAYIVLAVAMYVTRR